MNDSIDYLLNCVLQYIYNSKGHQMRRDASTGRLCDSVSHVPTGELPGAVTNVGIILIDH